MWRAGPDHRRDRKPGSRRKNPPLLGPSFQTAPNRVGSPRITPLVRRLHFLALVEFVCPCRHLVPPIAGRLTNRPAQNPGMSFEFACCPPAAAGGGAGRRRGLHNTPTATPFPPVQHPLTALPEPGRTTSYLGHPAYFFYAPRAGLA